MRLRQLDQIIVPTNRQRRDFDAQRLMELSESIERIGLLQPIVVREENGNCTLVAGERRIRACKTIYGTAGAFSYNGERVPENEIPTVTLGELSAIAAFEAELEENLRRVNLSWQEEADAVSRLHELRRTQNPHHAISDTASEVHETPNNNDKEVVGKQILIARFLDDPDVRSAASLRDAFKIVEKKEGLKNAAIRAAIVGETFSGASHQLFLGDCRDWLPKFPAAQFDCIITDPPYGMGADEFGDGAGKLVGIDHQYQDSESSFRLLLADVAPLIARAAKPAAHLYVCCDIDQFAWLKELFAASGWNVFRTPIINHKVGSGRVPLPEHGPRRTYELVLYAYRGGKRVTAIYPDLIDTRGDENLGHGAQKPIELYTDLLRRSCQAGDSVLDPFAGTGTLFPAAHEFKVRATGIERDSAYYGLASKRIEELE